MSEVATLSERIQRLEDIEAIARLRAEYCHYLDGRQWEDLANLFTMDGVFEGLQSVQGKDGLKAFFSEEVPRMQDGFWHFCSNGTVQVLGDRASGRLSMEFLSVTDDVSYVSAGHYDDTFVRDQGRWLFAARRITFYFYNRLSEGFRGFFPPERRVEREVRQPAPR